MSGAVSCIYEVFDLGCEVGVVYFAVASGDMFARYFCDDCIEFRCNVVDVCYVGSVEGGKEFFCFLCVLIPICLLVVDERFSVCFEFVGGACGDNNRKMV